MTDAYRDEMAGTAGTASEAPPGAVTLTTGRSAGDTVGGLADTLTAAGVVVKRRAFLPTRDDETSPQGVLLLAVAGPPLSLARLVAPATAPAGVVPALAAALRIGPDTDALRIGPDTDALRIGLDADQAPRTDPQTDPVTVPAPATLQLKAEGVFVVVRVQERNDLAYALDDLPAQIARLTVRRAERRLVYEAGGWRIDP